MPLRRTASRTAGRRLGRLALVLPALVILALDLVFRGDRILAFGLAAPGARSVRDALGGAHALAYLASALVSITLWGLLLLLGASRPRALRHAAGAMFLGLFTLSVAVQASFRLRFGIYLARDGTELSAHPLHAALGSQRLGILPACVFAASFLAAVFLLRFARQTLRISRRTRRRAAVLAALAWMGAFFLPVSYRQPQSTTPDLIWLNAVSVMARSSSERASGEASMQLRAPPLLAPIEASPARPRNVVLILQESVRADVVCVAYDPDCALPTRATNDLAPSRLPFLEARSNASSTAVAMAVLFTGLDPTAPAERLHAAPTLWELAHAAGMDTAYLSSQHLMFANMWLWVQDIPSGKITFATHLDPQADMFTGAGDDALAARVAAVIPTLREPFFLVIHPSNVHTPRRGEGIEGPFLPARDDKGDREAYFNAYKNAVFRSDRAVADMIRSLRAASSGPRTVVVYTSDHGESLWEHGQGCDHGCSLFEEEIRVPAWIDAPAGVLSPDEIAALSSARATPVFHVDLAATLLDLLGVWETPRFAAHRRLLLGQPLTRARREERTLPLSNVSHVWERGAPSYGLMRGRRKLAAMHRDGGFSCYDLTKDPGETRSVLDECGDLLRDAMDVYHRPPGEFDRLVFHPEWGPFVKE
jgi:glucan phosphoethanolaminetransferase (alkaline phosphatase superfamily)